VGNVAGAGTERGAPVTLGAAAAVPLRWEDELLGVLVVELGEGRDAGAAEIRLLAELASLASAAFRNATTHAELALAARTDGLTGCVNHAAMQDTLRREVERAARTARRLSLAIVDLDDFKQVNDEHGHQMGDEVLRAVGRTLRDNVRTYDTVARYGGDEFAVIAIDADEDTAAEVMTRALEGIGAALGDLGVSSRATAGVAEWTAGESPTMLIARADHSLLEGKQARSKGGVVRASGSG
jgi:diguanylate cyclase (GGDEF)-like protein